MLEKFGDLPRPVKIVVDMSLGRGKYGTYNDMTRTIRLNPSLIKEAGQDYATIVHEMAHHFDDILGDDSEKIVKDALKAIGIDLRSKRNIEYELAKIVGYFPNEKK